MKVVLQEGKKMQRGSWVSKLRTTARLVLFAVGIVLFVVAGGHALAQASNQQMVSAAKSYQRAVVTPARLTHIALHTEATPAKTLQQNVSATMACPATSINTGTTKLRTSSQKDAPKLNTQSAISASPTLQSAASTPARKNPAVPKAKQQKQSTKTAPKPQKSAAATSSDVITDTSRSVMNTVNGLISLLQ